MCSIRLRKQKVSSKNAAQIGLTSADHKGHRQSRQLHSTSKAAEDRPHSKTQAKNRARSDGYSTSAGECGSVLPLWIRAKLLSRRQGFAWLSAISRSRDRCPNRSNTAHWQFLVSGFACARLRNERRQLQQAT